MNTFQFTITNITYGILEELVELNEIVTVLDTDINSEGEVCVVTITACHPVTMREADAFANFIRRGL